MSHSLPSEMFDHYRQIDESKRLASGAGELEQTRTKELIERALPEEPSVILDVGGAAGVYSLWLARKGHEVHLIDAVPDHTSKLGLPPRGKRHILSGVVKWEMRVSSDARTPASMSF